MNRRQFHASALVFFALALSSPACAAQPAADWVRAAYEREIPLHLGHGSSTREEFLATLTPRTQEAWLASEKGPGPNEVGPILSPYFGWGVLPGLAVDLTGVESQQDDGTHALVKVGLRFRGAPHTVIVALQMVDGVWHIDDFAYDEGRALRAYLLQCAAEPC